MKKNIIIVITVASSLIYLGCNSNQDKSKGENVETVNVEDLLYSLSSIENKFPKYSTQQKDTFNLDLVEDDWRQLEFVHESLLSQVEQELDSIRDIVENYSVMNGKSISGFKKIHVRKLIPNPLNDGIYEKEVLDYFSSIRKGSLSIGGKIENGYYFNISNFQLYAIVENSVVKSIGLYGLTSWDKADVFREDIKKLMTEKELVLVDWRARMVINKDGIDDYLNPSN